MGVVNSVNNGNNIMSNLNCHSKETALVDKK